MKRLIPFVLALALVALARAAPAVDTCSPCTSFCVFYPEPDEDGNFFACAEPLPDPALCPCISRCLFWPNRVFSCYKEPTCPDVIFQDGFEPAPGSTPVSGGRAQSPAGAKTTPRTTPDLPQAPEHARTAL